MATVARCQYCDSSVPNSVFIKQNIFPLVFTHTYYHKQLKTICVLKARTVFQFFENRILLHKAVAIAIKWSSRAI